MAPPRGLCPLGGCPGVISVPVKVAVSVGCRVFSSSSLGCRVSDLLPVGEAVVSQTLPQFVTVEKDKKKNKHQLNP